MITSLLYSSLCLNAMGSATAALFLAISAGKKWSLQMVTGAAKVIVALIFVGRASTN